MSFDKFLELNPFVTQQFQNWDYKYNTEGETFGRICYNGDPESHDNCIGDWRAKWYTV